MEGRSTLASPWVFWLDEWRTGNGQTQEGPTKTTTTKTPEGGGSVTQVATKLDVMSTAREFWAQMDRLPVASIPVSSSLHIFRDGISPTWEDPSNISGGHFRIRDYPENYWVQLSMATVGEHFTFSHCVTGLTFSRKRNFTMICVWLSSSSQEVVVGVRDDVVRSLQSQRPVHIIWCVHSSIAKSGGATSMTITSAHRRTKSAPNPTQQDDDDDDTTSANGVDMSVGSETEKLSRAKPPSLNPDLLPQGGSGTLTHQRSKSESQSKETIPKQSLAAPVYSETTPPLTPTAKINSTSPNMQTKDTQRTSQEMAMRASGDSVRSSTDSWSKGWPIRPSPMKGVWADVPWSPSCLDGTTQVVVTTTTQVVRALPVAPEPPRRQEFGLSLPTPPPLPERDISFTPDGEEGDGCGRGDRRHAKATSFVFHGWLYPARLNRKERRRIMFTTEFEITPYEGALFVGNEVPDGNVDDALDAAFRRNQPPPKKGEAGKVTPPPPSQQTKSAQKPTRGHQRSVAFAEGGSGK